MFINRLDNKNETNGEPDNLRHHHNNNDLQSTCRKYQHEVNDLKIEKETIKEESKRLNDGIQQSFMGVYEGPDMEKLYHEKKVECVSGHCCTLPCK
jgi:hypothetical protein